LLHSCWFYPAGLFFTDLVKSVLLGAVFIPPLVAAFTYILQHAGPWVPLQLWAFVLVRTIARLLHGELASSPSHQ
jgi:hypothetical protein